MVDFDGDGDGGAEALTGKDTLCREERYLTGLAQGSLVEMQRN
jgi:hypothetical protein